MKIGDKVAYLKYDISNWQSRQIAGDGIVFYIADDKIGVIKYGYSPEYIDLNSSCQLCVTFSEDVKSQFNDVISKEIEILRSRIKKLTSEEKDELKKKKFNELISKIVSTAYNMCEASDESRFLNCLHEICKMKTQLYSIKIEDLENTHKYNGGIKYKIRQLQKLLEQVNNYNFYKVEK
jgi:ERCC4-related helicase